MNFGINTARSNINLFRSFSSYLLILFFVSLLAACGGGGGTPANTAPTATDDTLVTDEDTSATGTLSGTDPDTADTLSYSIVTNGISGSATIDDASTGTYTYVPNANANGADSFTFIINDGTINSAEATITVTINPVNDAPVGDDGSLTTTEDNTATGTVTGNDPEATDTLSYSIAINGSKGTATIDNVATGAYTYVPNADANGADSFTFIINDGTVNSAEATISVTITAANDAPVGVNDNYAATEGVPLVVNAAAGVLINDTDVDIGDSLTAVIVGPATNGTVVLAADGSFTYTTTVATFSGTDSFTYVVNDTAPSASATTTVNITVSGINNVPSFNKGANDTSVEDAGTQTIVGWATAIDAGAPDESGQALSFNVTNDNNVLFAVQPAIAANGDLTYTAATDANGAAIVTVSLSDDGGVLNGGVDTSAAQIFLLTVTAVNDAPSFTKGLDETVLEDAGLQTVTNWATVISTGPADESGQAIAAFNVSTDNDPLFSVLPAVDNITGDLTYTPAANANGGATITVSATDNGGGTDTSAPQMFVINVSPQNDNPVANAGIPQNVDELAVVNLDGSASNDTIDGDTLLYTWTQTDSAGLAVTLDNNTIQSPSFRAPAVSSQQILTFELSVDDQNGGVVVSTVNITVDPVNFVTSTVSNAPQTIDLNAEGSIDWVHLGRGGTTTRNEKSAVNDISAVALTNISGNQGGFTNFNDDVTQFSWTDGTPTATEAGTIDGVFTTILTGGNFSAGDGYEFTVANVDNVNKTLTLYLGVFRSTATITASLENSGSPNVAILTSTPVTIDNSVNTALQGLHHKLVTINFGGGVATADTLRVKVTEESDSGIASNVSISAVTLANAVVAAPVMSPSAGTGTDTLDLTLTSATTDANIHFTTDGSAPTTADTVFTTPITLNSVTSVRAIAVYPGLNDSAESQTSYTVSPSINGATLAGQIAIPPVVVDLTTEGATDWAHWGHTGSTITQKDDGLGAPVGMISDVSEIDPSNTVLPQTQFTDNLVAFNWIDGVTTTTASDLFNGIFFNVTNADFSAGTQGFTLSVTPGDTNMHTLKLYFGTYHATTTLTATLNGSQSFSGVISPIDEATSQSLHRVAIFEFAAANGADSLVIEVKMSNIGINNPGNANVTLEAATLQ